MTGGLLLAVLLSSYQGVYGVIYGGAEVAPLCVLAGGLTGILTHQSLQESTETEEAVDTNTNPCTGEACGGKGECVTAFCDCKGGFCGRNCEKSTQETGEACPCGIPHSLCVENTCVCDCEFTFNQAVNLCVKDCPRGFADTFTFFDNLQLQLSAAAILQTLPGAGKTIEQQRIDCNTACLQNPSCRAYTINKTTINCILVSVSKDDAGLLTDNNSETYERDCIGEMS